MPFTTSQKQALKASIIAATEQACVNLEASPTNSDFASEVAALYNLTAAPDYYVWRDLPMEILLNTVSFSNMTPADSVPTTPDLAVQVWIARAVACQGKQLNWQNLTTGRNTAPMKRSNYRAALQDCLTNIPAGASGAAIAANWVGVRDAAKFLATRAEKLFATGAGTLATPADLSYEGQVSYQDVLEAMQQA